MLSPYIRRNTHPDENIPMSCCKQALGVLSSASNLSRTSYLPKSSKCRGFIRPQYMRVKYRTLVMNRIWSTSELSNVNLCGHYTAINIAGLCDAIPVHTRSKGLRISNNGSQLLHRKRHRLGLARHSPTFLVTRCRSDPYTRRSSVSQAGGLF